MIFPYLNKNIRFIDQLTDKNNLYLVPERAIFVREFTVFPKFSEFKESNKSLKHEMG